MEKMMPLEGDAEGPGRRGDARVSVLLVATIRRADGAGMFPVRVRNLSTGGMMIETEASFRPGEAVAVEIRNVGLVPGRIAWTRTRKCGVRFDDPIDPALARRPMAVMAKTGGWIGTGS